MKHIGRVQVKRLGDLVATPVLGRCGLKTLHVDRVGLSEEVAVPTNGDWGLKRGFLLFTNVVVEEFSEVRLGLWEVA